jgi:hypothetical protein
MNKIAFLFLTQKELTQEKIWVDFFDSADKEKYNLYFHTKPNFKHKKFSQYQIDSIETKWGTFSLVEAQQILLNEALKDESNKHFIFVSESTIPICSFEELYSFFSDKEKFSIISYEHCVSSYFLPRFRMIKNIYNWTIEQWHISSQWVVLNREHSTIFKDNFKTLKEIFSETKHPEEHSYVTFLYHLGVLNNSNIINKNITFVDWSGNNGTLPSSYKPKEITERLIEKLKNDGYFFMRKILSGEEVKIF